MTNIAYTVQPALESVTINAVEELRETGSKPALILKITGCLLLILLVVALTAALIVWMNEVIPPIVKAYTILSERRPF